VHVGYETDESRSFIVDSRATAAAAGDDQHDDDSDCYNETAERHHHVPHITCHVITHTATPSFSHASLQLHRFLCLCPVCRWAEATMPGPTAFQGRETQPTLFGSGILHFLLFHSLPFPLLPSFSYAPSTRKCPAGPARRSGERCVLSQLFDTF